MQAATTTKKEDDHDDNAIIFSAMQIDSQTTATLLYPSRMHGPIYGQWMVDAVELPFHDVQENNPLRVFPVSPHSSSLPNVSANTTIGGTGNPESEGRISIVHFL
jgi:hypothetical protein